MKANAQVEDLALSDFEIHENVLIVNIELYWENHDKFRQYCDSLLNTPATRIVLDLSHVNFIFSAYMGTIGTFLASAARTGKQVTIRIPKSLAWLFDVAGFRKVVDFEIVP